MAHVGQNAPLKPMWDPPEGSSTKYHVLSVAHIRNAPWIFYKFPEPFNNKNLKGNKVNKLPLTRMSTALSSRKS
jgi:hypothetical protein